jgi:predicted PurR-regulated permease PerM
MTVDARLLRTVTVWLALVVVGRWVFERNAGFLFLLLLAWLLAIAMDPAIAWGVRRGLKRGLATGLVLLGIVVATVAFAAVFGKILFSQAASLLEAAPDIVTNFVNWLNSFFKLTLDPTSIINTLNVTPANAAKWASHFAGGLFGLLSTLLGGVFQMLTMMLFAYYIAAEGPQMRRIVGSMLPTRAQQVFVTTWDIAVKKTGGFVVSKVVLALVSGVVHSTFYAVLGIPYWLPMGIITAVTGQFIPTVGTYLGVLIPGMIAAFQNPIDVLWIAGFAAVYQQFENYYLSPRISRKTMDIHPAIAFASVIVFANLFGAMGALIAIPLAAAIVSIVDTYAHRHELIPELR